MYVTQKLVGTPHPSPLRLSHSRSSSDGLPPPLLPAPLPRAGSRALRRRSPLTRSRVWDKGHYEGTLDAGVGGLVGGDLMEDVVALAVSEQLDTKNLVSRFRCVRGL
jgi:hypothetical protein